MDYKIAIRANQHYLNETGPLVAALWKVTEARETELKKLGQPVPEPVSGHLLLDTGAGTFMIERTVAEELNLPTYGKGPAYGISGSGQFERYEAIVVLPVIPVSHPQPYPVSIGFPALCIESNLHEQFSREKYTTFEGGIPPNHRSTRKNLIAIHKALL